MVVVSENLVVGQEEEKVDLGKPEVMKKGILNLPDRTRSLSINIIIVIIMIVIIIIVIIIIIMIVIMTMIHLRA